MHIFMVFYGFFLLRMTKLQLFFSNVLFGLKKKKSLNISSCTDKTVFYIGCNEKISARYFTSLFSTAIYVVVYRYFFMNFSKQRTPTTTAYRKPVTGILTDKFKITTVSLNEKKNSITTYNGNPFRRHEPFFQIVAKPRCSMSPRFSPISRRSGSEKYTILQTSTRSY